MLVAEFRSAWAPENWRDLGVVVGCSGGADSVALLRALDATRASQPNSQPNSQPGARGFLVAAHYHHGMRGDEADGDALFVRDLAEQLGIQFVQASGDGQSTDELSLRNQRQTFLREAAQQTGARYICLAHSLDDNVETVLHHLMRGTGPAGLAGIPRLRAVGPDPIGQDLVLIRPLLTVRRELIRQALRAIGQPWREDSSNQDTAYRRNWIRSELIPLMQTQYPKAIEAVARSIDSQSNWRRTIESVAANWLAANLLTETPLVVRRDVGGDESIVISALQCLWQSNDWSRRDMSSEHWKRVAQTVMGTDSQRYSLPGDVDVVANDAKVTIVMGSKICD